LLKTKRFINIIKGTTHIRFKFTCRFQRFSPLIIISEKIQGGMNYNRRNDIRNIEFKYEKGRIAHIY